MAVTMKEMLKKSWQSNLTKFLVFALATFCAVAGISLVSSLYYSGYHFSPEPMFEADYLKSDYYTSNIVNAAHKTLSLPEGGEEPDTRNQFEKYYYYLKDATGTVFTNVPQGNKAFFEARAGSFLGERGQVVYNGASVSPYAFGFPYEYDDFGKIELYIVFGEEFIAGEQANWDVMRQLDLYYSRWIGGYLLVMLLCVAFLIGITGRKYNEEGYCLSPIDKVFPDVMLIGLCVTLAAWIATLERLMVNYYSMGAGISAAGRASVLGISIVTGIAFVCCLVMLLSLVRHIKKGTILKNSLSYIMVNFIWTTCKKIVGFVRKSAGDVYRIIKGFFDLSNKKKYQKYPFLKIMQRRQLAFILVEVVLILFFFAFLFNDAAVISFILMVTGVVLAVFFVYKNNALYEDMGKLFDQIECMNNGDFASNVQIPMGAQLYGIGQKLNNIGDGFAKSVEDQMKSERMKIDLITNVSHDLKTPLTSIISYVDLLSKDDSLSQEAMDYVNILSQKSYRLKNIVSDLFVLAKSTSGNIEVERENIDLKKLAEQTVADMEDAIAASGRILKTNLPRWPVEIVADGKKLYRVMQNILDNALKYSMPGTRVFVDLEQTERQAVLTVKNTAGYEMNFSEEEVMERFVRADASRTTEGSGLGLSIAQSFTAACGGVLQVSIDGDQFKVTICFEKRV